MVLRPAFGKDAKEILTPEWREEQNETPHKCPRCDSPNTKFCYYNNYSRSQPRHFCRACRRYWTEGGTLRNVPFGGCRKNKRRKIIPAAIAATGNITPSFRITPGGVERGISPHVLYNAAPDSPSGYSVNEFFYPPLLHSFMEDFTGVSLGFVWSGGFTAATASSCSSSCQDVGGRGEDGLLGRMGASRATAWANEETSLPAHNWDSWYAHNWDSWYDAAEFIDAGGRQVDITFQQGTAPN